MVAALALVFAGHVGFVRTGLAVGVGARAARMPSLPSALAMADEPLPPAYSLPDSFEDASRACSAAVVDALRRGITRLRVDFDTSAGDITYTSLRNSMPIARALMELLSTELCGGTAALGEDEASTDQAQPAKVLQILLPDEGTAALVTREWAPPPTVKCSCLARFKLPDEAVACLIVAPTALDTTALDALMNSEAVQSSGVPLVVLNPQLVDLTTGALGLEGRNVVKRLAREFQDVYVLRTLPGAALTRVYPENYAVWQEDPSADGGFRLVRDDARRPSETGIMEELAGDDQGSGPGFLKEVKGFIKGLQSL